MLLQLPVVEVVVVITGARGRVGKALSEAFVRTGAQHVALRDMHSQSLQLAEENLTQHFENIYTKI